MRGILCGLIALAALFASGGIALAGSSTPATVEWRVGDSLFIAGRDLTIGRKLSGSLTVTGETIEITRDSHVDRDLWIAGRRVAYEGDTGGDLSIRSQDALIDGHVKGDVSFYGLHLAFGPDARVDGNVHYLAAGPAEIDAGAVIKGSMKSSVLDSHPAGGESGWRDNWVAPGYRLSWAGAVFFGILAGIAMLIAPESAARLRDAAVSQPLMALAAGFIWLIGTPILAVVALVTIVGLPLALIIVLLWPLGIVLGLIATMLVLAEIFSARFSFTEDGPVRRIAGVALATVAMWIGFSLPAFGGIVWLGAVTLGIGAMALAGRVRFTVVA